METKQLKACPFCGGDVTEDPDKYPPKTFRGSIICEVDGFFEMTPEEWNTRSAGNECS